MSTPTGNKASCQQCRSSFRFEDRHRGKVVRCPKCQCKVAIPSAEPDPFSLTEFEERPMRDDVEFAHTCKTCKAKLHFTERQIGTSTKCPDCHSIFVVPPPNAHARWSPVVRSQGGDGFALTNEEGQSRKESNFLYQEPNDILAKAEKELVEKEQEVASYFDDEAKGWLVRYFGFVRDGQVRVTAIITGLCLATVFLGLHYAKTHVDDLSPFGVRLAYFAGFLAIAPLMAYWVSTGFAVLDTAANRLRRAREWPGMDPTEWAGEAWMILFVILLAGAPGSLVGYLLMSIGVPSQVGIACIGFTIWSLGPWLLLGMMDNASLLRPFSSHVGRSLTKCADAWGAYYLFSAVAAGSLVGLLVWSEQPSFIPSFIVGVLIPWILYWWFHQLGILADSIAESTVA